MDIVTESTIGRVGFNRGGRILVSDSFDSLPPSRSQSPAIRFLEDMLAHEVCR